MQKKNKILILDLDGTYIDTNSLNEFAKWLLKTITLRKKLLGSAGILFAVAMRKLRIFSHKKAKWIIMNIADRHLGKTDYLAFATVLQQHIRHRFSFLPDDAVKILATAAPVQYCRVFADKMGFDFLTATEMSPSAGTYEENRGYEKRCSVEKLLDADNLASLPVVFYSDSEEDTPLIEYVAEKGGESYLISAKDIS